MLQDESTFVKITISCHNWVIISLKDFCIVIRTWPTFWPSMEKLNICYIIILSAQEKGSKDTFTDEKEFFDHSGQI